MGLIISRFRRKETTIEILEHIDKDITRLQKNRKDNQDSQKRIATSLLIYSFIVYVLSAIVFFFLYFPETWPLRLLYSLPLLAFPFLIWGVRKLLHWYFVKRIHGNDLALRDLRERKKQILEDVMETETYKKAKEILEKFDPARFKRLESNEAVSNSGATSPTSPTAPDLRHRKPVSQHTTPATATRTARLPQQMGRTPNPYVNTPLRAPTPAVRAVTPGLQAAGPRPQKLPQPLSQSVTNTPQQMPRGPVMGRGYAVPPGPPMPRSVLPRDRGTMDRLMDYLVGDGPENRYALICSICSSHNGMALKEEFEYMSFRCCYCYNFNPARKQRPMAPRLEFFTPGLSGGMKPSGQDESDEDDDDDEEEEDEEKADGGVRGSDARKPPAQGKPSLNVSQSSSQAGSVSPSHSPGRKNQSPVKGRGQRAAPTHTGSDVNMQQLQGFSKPSIAQQESSAPGLDSTDGGSHAQPEPAASTANGSVDQRTVKSASSLASDNGNNQNQIGDTSGFTHGDSYAADRFGDAEIVDGNGQIPEMEKAAAFEDMDDLLSADDVGSREMSSDELIKDAIREGSDKAVDFPA